MARPSRTTIAKVGLCQPSPRCIACSSLASFYGWNAADKFIGAWRAAGFRMVGHIVFTKRYASSSRFVQSEHEQAYLLAKVSPRNL